MKFTRGALVELLGPYSHFNTGARGKVTGYDPYDDMYFVKMENGRSIGGFSRRWRQAIDTTDECADFFVD